MLFRLLRRCGYWQLQPGDPGEREGRSGTVNGGQFRPLLESYFEIFQGYNCGDPRHCALKPTATFPRVYCRCTEAAQIRLRHVLRTGLLSSRASPHFPSPVSPCRATTCGNSHGIELNWKQFVQGSGQSILYE